MFGTGSVPGRFFLNQQKIRKHTKLSSIQRVKLTLFIWAGTRENLSSKPDSNQSPQLQRLARKLKFHIASLDIILSTKRITKVLIRLLADNSNEIWASLRENLSLGFPTARLKPVSSATETRQKSEISLVASLDMILSNKRITKALIRLRGCAGWSAHLLFENHRRQVFSH